MKNPLLDLHPDLEFLDRGFLDGATYRMDFLDPQAIVPLADKFGLTYCFYTLEHVRDPWLWCKHLLYITAPGGYVYLSTVFWFPYHPSPEDYWRFSPDALGLLFEGENILWKGWEDRVGVAILVRKRHEEHIASYSGLSAVRLCVEDAVPAAMGL